MFDPDTDPNQRPNDRAPQDANRRSWLVAGLVIAVVSILFVPRMLQQNDRKQIPYNQFIALAEKKQVKSATVNNDSGKITGTFQNGNTTVAFETTGPHPPSDQQFELLQDVANYKDNQPSLILSLFSYIGPLLIIVLLWFVLMRRASGQMSGIMNIGRSRAKVYSTERPKTTFSDVAGYEGVKREITEVVDFLKDPTRFRAIGARIPKGVLLVGPPGTGKTLIARAVAGEAGVPFLFITGSDFMEMFVGVGASRVRDLFETARKSAPAIIFVDEIDSIGRKRGAGLGGGHDEREQTLNQMLSEMDGFEGSEGVVMIAATNRPDILDPALLRPGRFDREIVVPLPDLEERLPILRVHIRDKKVADDVDLGVVARGTPGMSGADLANLVNEAALHAVRRGSQDIHMEDFEAARDRIFMGQRRESTVLSDEEKKMTAYHEGGHAVLGYVLPDADPVHKVTILPTGKALGVTQQLPMEEKHSYDESYIRDRLAVLMGGRVAERLVFDNISTGGSNDLQRATEIAKQMVREWGMSERVGPMAWGQQGQVFLGEDLVHNREYSDETSRVIDEEVERILREEEERALEVLSKHRTGLDAVAEALLERETIPGAEVGSLVDEAHGEKVHPNGKLVPTFVPRLPQTNGNGGADATNGHGDTSPGGTSGATDTTGSAMSSDTQDAPVPLEDDTI